MNRLLVVALLVAVMAVTVFPPPGPEPTPQPGPHAPHPPPPAGAFGKGWHLSQTVSPDLLARYAFTMSPDVFREGAASIYIGRGGGRIVVVSLLITNTRVAIRQAWEDATDLLDNVESDASTDYQ